MSLKNCDIEAIEVLTQLDRTLRNFRASSWLAIFTYFIDVHQRGIFGSEIVKCLIFSFIFHLSFINN